MHIDMDISKNQRERKLQLTNKYMMEKTLVLVAHPQMATSRINKRLEEELEKNNDLITVHDLYSLYPMGRLNVKQEQEFVDRHQNIVFQFPIYWYSCPPLLKLWFDDVLTPDWAYMNKFALTGKTITCAVTAGGSQQDYVHSGNTANMEEVLTPFRMSANYLKAVYKPSFVIYNTFDINNEELNTKAKEYIDFIRKL